MVDRRISSSGFLGNPVSEVIDIDRRGVDTQSVSRRRHGKAGQGFGMRE
jgi:hypothetical protein